MLLLTILPFAGWATDVVKVGNYDFTVNSRLVELGSNFAISAVSDGTETAYSVDPGVIYNTQGQIVPELTEVGSYFQQVAVSKGEGDNITTEYVFVPFMVVKSGEEFFNTENIWNSTTWDASVEDGILSKYFTFDWAQNFDQINGDHVWKSIITNVSHPQRSKMFPQINYQIQGLENGEKYAVYATYKVQTQAAVVDGPDAAPAVYETRDAYTEWDAQTGKPALYGNNSFWMLSIPALYKGNCPYAPGTEPNDADFFDANYTLTYNEAEDETVKKDGEPLEVNSTIADALTADFAWDYVSLYLAPQEAPFKMTATLTNPTLAYTNSVKDPGLRVYVGQTQVGPKTNDNENGYTVKWYQDGEESQLIKPGDYIGIVTYKDNVAIVEFTITRAAEEIILNPAYVEKVYGSDDPAPKFKREGGVIYEGDNLEEAIMPYLVLKRSDEDPIATREDVGDHKYYIDFTDAYRAGECNYEITILQNHSILTIIPAPLSIQVTEATASKEYKKTDPAFAYVNDDAMKSQLKFEDAAKASGTPGASDIITSITRAKAGEEGGEVVGQEYAFTATSKNYKVTVTNGFTIVPSTDVSGLKFQFQKEPNSDVYLDGAAYTYNGQEQTPKFKLIDTDADPDYELEPGVDYWATGTEHMPVYANNKDVTNAATVTVTLAGNYSGEVTGTFAITKKDLTIVATSYTAEPAEYEFTYDGFVEGESAATEADKNTDEVTYFKAPTAPVVTKGDEIETDVYKLVAHKDGAEAKNYEFKTQDGLLALNGTQIISVKAVKFDKEYDGKDVTSEDLKDNIAVYDERNNPILGFPMSKLVLANGPIYEIAKAATGRKHNVNRPAYPSNQVATGANEGFYDITLRGPSVIQGYTINWVGLENGCEIQFRNITLKAADKTKVFGAAVPTLTASVVPAEEVEREGETVVVGGLIGDDTEQSIGLVNGNNGYYVSIVGWSGSNNVPGYWYNTNEQVTTTDPDTRYTIRPVCQSTNSIYGNYQVTTADGKLAVTKAKVLIAAADATKQFGTADPEFDITVTPADDGTPASVATKENMRGLWTITRTDKDAADGEAVGAHKTLKLTLNSNAVAAAKNFDITASTENGTLTITKAQLRVEAKGQWITYGGEINPYDVRITKPGSEELYDVLVWTKRGVDAEGNPEELTPEQEKMNNDIMSLGHLEILEGKMEIGTNYDAFKFVVDDANYEIAPDKTEGNQTILGFKNNTLLVYPLDVIPLDKDMLAEILKNKALTPKTLNKVLQDHQGCTVTVILPGRAMKANDWYAWVLPFKVKQRDFFRGEGTWGYGAMETLDEAKTTDKSVSFTLTVQPIEANTPFLVKVDEDITAEQMKSIEIEGVTIGEFDYLTENPASGSANTVQFVGLYDEKTGFDETTRYLRRVPNASAPLEFWPGGPNSANVTLPRTYAFLQFPTAAAAADAKIYIQEPDGTYTAIGGVEGDVNNTDAIYNLSGQRVNKVQKGIYIQDGKKVLVK